MRLTTGSVRRVARWVRSPSVRVAILFALVGVGFAGASLILARALTREELGITALWLAVYYVGSGLAPWGADGVVNRRRIRPGWRLVRRTTFTSAVTACAVVAGAVILYPFSTPYLLLLWASVVVGGLGTVAAAQFQARQAFVASMMIWRGSNLVLVVAAGAALLGPDAGPLLPIGVFAAGQGLVTIAGWIGLRRVAAGEPDVGVEPFAWREALSYFAAASAAAVLPQVERLVIPGMLSVEDLAVFSVLAALVISPYRMLQAGIGYTLFPRLSKAETKRRRRHLVRDELGMMLVGGMIAGLAAWQLTPVVIGALLGDKYVIGGALLVAGIVAGFARLVEAFGRALVSALGTNRELALYGMLSWASLGLASLGAWVGAAWGITGVIYGITAGLSLRSLSGLVLGLRHLESTGREPGRAVQVRRRPKVVASEADISA